MYARRDSCPTLFYEIFKKTSKNSLIVLSWRNLENARITIIYFKISRVLNYLKKEKNKHFRLLKRRKKEEWRERIQSEFLLYDRLTQ